MGLSWEISCILQLRGDSIEIDGIFSEVAVVANGPNKAVFQVAGRPYEVRRYDSGAATGLLLVDVVKEDIGYRYIFTDKDLSGNPL